MIGHRGKPSQKTEKQLYFPGEGSFDAESSNRDSTDGDKASFFLMGSLST